MADNSAARAARANIHPSTLDAMAKVGSYNVLEDLAASRFAHSPSGVIPTNHSESTRPVARGGDGSGWQHEIPLVRNDQHPTAGVAACDRLMDAADVRDRAAAEAQAGGGFMEVAMTAMTMVLQTNQALIQKLAEATTKE